MNLIKSLGLLLGVIAFLCVFQLFPLPAKAQTASPEILSTATYNGHTYYLLSSDNWTNSESYAQSLGGHLATINDEAESAFVFNTFTEKGKINRGLWIGLNDVDSEGSFVWASGEAVAFTKFAVGEPNNGGSGEDYVHMFYPSDSRAPFWNDAPDVAVPFEGIPMYGVVEVATGGTPTPTPPPTILQTAYYNGHTYQLLETDNWTSSEAYAQALGGHLVTINDEAENAFVFSTFTQNGTMNRGLWIGLNDAAVEGEFVWASGEPVAFTKFAAGEPNNSGSGEDYVHIFYPFDSRASSWNDARDFAYNFGVPFYGVVETITNLAPTVSAGGPYEVIEDGSVQVSATGNDPENGNLTYAWDLDDNGSFETPGQSVTFSAAGLDGPDTRNINVQVTDDGDLTATDQADVNVNNANPSITTITAPTTPQPVNTVINTSAVFTDAGVLDTHTAVWDWGDGSTSTGTVTESNGSGTVVGSHTYTTAEVYTITLTVTDDDLASDTKEFMYVVVYNPAGGFVTGAGRFNAPAGSIISDPAKSGMTNFGTNAKYVNNVLTGSTKLNFRDGQYAFDFDSTQYDWLVVTNGNLAKLHGSGSVNGVGGYTFELTALDNAPDTIRLRIWDATNMLVYDNNTSALTNGNIDVHN
jgi:hypothetical protein